MEREQKNFMLRLEDLSKDYGGSKVVDAISFGVYKGELLTLLGPSGAGKSTILKMVAGFVSPTTGKVFLNGEDITEKDPHKRKIGMFFQKPMLFPHMTVSDNIAFSLRTPEYRTKETVIGQKVRDVLRLIRLEGFEKRYPKQLSGGQEQRVALARAMIFEAPVLLLDEPLGALDRKLREHMQYEIRRIQQSLKITILYVTHDQSEAMAISDRIAVINAGRILQVGTPLEIYQNPKHIFVAEFVGESNCIAADLVSSEKDYFVLSLGSSTTVKAPRRDSHATAKRLYLVVRPENIRFVQDVNNYDVVLEGLLRKMTFLGDVYRFEIEIEKGLVVLVVRPATEDFKGIPVGQKVKIGWNMHEGVTIV